MSKDSLNQGGRRLTLEDLMSINPDLANVGAGTAPPAATEEPATIRTTTPEAIESFYGSGDRIVQPDQSYYQDFALPGVQMERPNPDAPVTSDPVATQPADTSSQDSGFDAGIGGESGAYIPSNGYVPDGLAEAYEIANRQSVSQRRRSSAQDMIAAYQANRRSMPIEGGTGNQAFGGLFSGETTGNANQRTRDEMQAAQDARANGLPAAVSRDEMQARYEANMARRAAMGIDNSPRSGFFTSGFMPGDPGYEEALAAAPPAAGGLFSGRTNMSPEQIAQLKAAQAARRNGGGSGGLLGFAGQPSEEDLQFSASMPILDAADGQYQPDMRAYMNYLGGMR
jgi:hypothetical protein